MKVAFRKHDPSFFAGLIRLWTKSPYSHCELLFDDGLMFSASPEDNGTRYTAPGILSANSWDILLVPMTLEDTMTIKVFCESELNCKYDWLGIWFSQVVRLQRESKTRWFCSEFCASALQQVGYLFGAKPCTFSPGKLYKRLKESGAIVCAQ